MTSRGNYDTSHTSLESILGEEASLFKLTSGGEPKEALVRDIVSSLEALNYETQKISANIFFPHNTKHPSAI